MIKSTAWAAILSAVVLHHAKVADAYDPQVGKLHPEFLLPDIDTKAPIALSAYRGKKVLLIQFASW